MKLISLLRIKVIIGLIILLFFSINVVAQYCTPAPTMGCANGDYPTQFALTGTLISINDPSLTCTGGGYQDRTATDTLATPSPSTPAGTITANPFSGSSSSSFPGAENMQIYVDWNNDGVFQSSESVGGINPVNTTSTPFTITVPTGEATGFYRMRLVFTTTTSGMSYGASSTYPNIDPCLNALSSTFFNFPYNSGMAIDYTLEIVVACSSPTLSLGAGTCTTQVINWTAVSGSTGYEYVVSTSATPPTGAGTATTALTYTATGLTTGTKYYVYVRNNCGGGTYSTWTSVSFTTPGPDPITGVANVCPGNTTNLSDATASGTWSSSNTAIATISGTGVVTGITAGTTVISYSAGGACSATVTVTVGPLPAITGTTNICPGYTTNLSDAVAGGTWSSSNTAVATVVPGTGVVSGIAGGTSTITYTRGSCSVNITVTITTLAAITPAATATVCSGLTTALSDATTGGTWSSSSTATATVSTTGVVSGVKAGTVQITYSLGSCSETATVTVITLSAISGNTNLCGGSTISLSDASGGGTWSSGNTSVATVGPTTGIVTGVTSGTAAITYSGGGCSKTTTVSVAGSVSPITGPSPAIVCTGATIALSDATASGTWSSSSSAIATVSTTGVVSGATAGTVNITYTFGSCTVSYSVTVGTAAITGATTVCPGTTSALSDATPNGTWSSGNAAVATISATGVVSGLTGGTSVITYTFSGCSKTATITVVSLIVPANPTVCAGSTVNLSDATSGGTWSSTTTTVATIGVGGLVHGVTGGTDVISYTLSSCTETTTVTVISISAISGTATLCIGSTVILSDTQAGGTWSSGTTTVATVTSTTGIVTGVAAGKSVITYAYGGCSKTFTVTVSGTLTAISGGDSVCIGSTITLSDGTAGGAWSSTNTSVATIGSGTGIVTGVSVGVSDITYSVGTCTVGFVVTVDPKNAGTITGIDTTCIGYTTSLSDAVAGGTWSSSNVAVATVVSATGVVSGASTGTTTIAYIVTNACGTYTATVLMRILPAVNCPLGIVPITSQDAELKVFPNPNAGTFTMNLLSAVADEEVHVVITNIVGQKVSEFVTTTNKTVDIKLNPAAGIYLLSATTAHGKYITKVEISPQ